MGTTDMKIGFGCDHVGIDMKLQLIEYLKNQGFQCIDYCSNDKSKPQDYPISAQKVTNAILSGEVDKGLLICGTGVGMSIAANKVPGIRACVCSEPYSSKLTVEHNNANVLCLGARVIAVELAKMICDAFFRADFQEGIHTPRVQMIQDIENKYCSK